MGPYTPQLKCCANCGQKTVCPQFTHKPLFVHHLSMICICPLFVHARITNLSIICLWTNHSSTICPQTTVCPQTICGQILYRHTSQPYSFVHYLSTYLFVFLFCPQFVHA